MPYPNDSGGTSARLQVSRPTASGLKFRNHPCSSSLMSSIMGSTKSQEKAPIKMSLSPAAVSNCLTSTSNPWKANSPPGFILQEKSWTSTASPAGSISKTHGQQAIWQARPPLRSREPVPRSRTQAYDFALHASLQLGRFNTSTFYAARSPGRPAFPARSSSRCNQHQRQPLFRAPNDRYWQQ